MSKPLNLVLTPEQFTPITSPYLDHGRKSESWEIGEVIIDGKQLRTVVRMTTTYLSQTDNGSFHLSFITGLEFLSQLMIIYGHAWAGLESKTREGWMVESSTRNLRPIRDPDHIAVEMEVDSIRELRGTLYCVAQFKVTDRQDGYFTVKLKAVMP